eukprot:CAMPEP_0115264116 /NCGR_PEP_ID=MMETSP0270-20121206/50263_1 /TAXON_ID=71861 /ORGANISM="Scrippsiella trochoidea, Strain CCMP3099" /LENGTH=31 /DNA_ID= /DNA_START= /DNA_END= /DNA_ORIENTATION=
MRWARRRFRDAAAAATAAAAVPAAARCWGAT